ncbi:hypothetical protein VL14_08885 [Cytobacillus firmus]|nr:hypothetical protein VL14_08885 [Cytobacillus firmus]
MRIFFVRCSLKEAYSKSCGSSGTGETPQTRSVEEAHRPPRCSLSILERKSTDNIDRRKQLQKEPFAKDLYGKFKIIFTIHSSDNTIKKEWKNIPNTINRRRGK